MTVTDQGDAAVGMDVTPDAPDDAPQTGSTDSPTAPAPAPPGDFTTSAFWTSPSTYLTFSTYLLPLFVALFGSQHGQQALDAVVAAAPMLATIVLVIQRNANHRHVQALNAQLAQQRLAAAPPVVGGTVLQIKQLEAKVADLEKVVAVRRRTPRTAAVGG